MIVASSVSAARAAVAGFARIPVDETGKQVNLGSSTVASIQAGATAAAELRARVSEMILGVKGQADTLTTLAVEIEGRDASDSATWGDSA